MRSKAIPNIKELILQYFCQDMTQVEIAKKLGYSTKAVNKYTDSLREDYGVKTVQGLIYRHLKSPII